MTIKEAQLEGLKLKRKKQKMRQERCRQMASMRKQKKEKDGNAVEMGPSHEKNRKSFVEGKQTRAPAKKPKLSPRKLRSRCQSSGGVNGTNNPVPPAVVPKTTRKRQREEDDGQTREKEFGSPIPPEQSRPSLLAIDPADLQSLVERVSSHAHHCTGRLTLETSQPGPASGGVGCEESMPLLCNRLHGCRGGQKLALDLAASVQASGTDKASVVVRLRVVAKTQAATNGRVACEVKGCKSGALFGFSGCQDFRVCSEHTMRGMDLVESAQQQSGCEEASTHPLDVTAGAAPPLAVVVGVGGGVDGPPPPPPPPRVCEAPGCRRAATHGLPADGHAPLFCPEHAPAGCRRPCRHRAAAAAGGGEGCPAPGEYRPAGNYAHKNLATTPWYCGRHKPAGRAARERPCAHPSGCCRAALWRRRTAIAAAAAAAGASGPGGGAEAPPSFFCRLHKEAEMVKDHPGPTCDVEGCVTTASYRNNDASGPGPASRTKCNAHHLPGMFGRRWSTKDAEIAGVCAHNGCSRLGTFEYEKGDANDGDQSPNRIQYCPAHKRPGMKHIWSSKGRCTVEGCSLPPVFSLKGPAHSMQTHCVKHKLKGIEMFKKQGVCADSSCDKRQTYGFPGCKNKDRVCSFHRKIGMVNMRHSLTLCQGSEDCGKRATFGFPGGRAERCKAHSLEGMADVRNEKCQEPNCKKSASYNVEGEKKRLFCGEHKKFGMVHVSYGRCEAVGCGNTRAFNFASERQPRFCTQHRLNGMVDVVAIPRCVESNCKRPPCYAFQGDRKATCCDIHKKDGMTKKKRQ